MNRKIHATSNGGKLELQYKKSTTMFENSVIITIFAKYFLHANIFKWHSALGNKFTSLKKTCILFYNSLDSKIKQIKYGNNPMRTFRFLRLKIQATKARQIYLYI